MNLRKTCLLFLLLFFFSPLAAAQDRAAAEALFQAGSEAAESGDYDTACQKFEASNRLDPAPGTILNIADCKEQLGLLASAWQRYREAAEKIPQGDERQAYASDKARQLKSRVPHLTLTVVGVQTDFQVYRGKSTVPQSALELPLPMDPGTHEFTLEASGRESTVTSIELSEGQNASLKLQAGAPTAAPAVANETPEQQQTSPQEAKPSSRRVWGWSAVGLGVVGLGVGGVSGMIALSKKKVVNQECNSDDYCRSQKGVDAAASGRTFSTISTIGFAVGAVALSTGVVLLLTGPKKKEKLSLQLSPTWSGANLSLQGSL